MLRRPFESAQYVSIKYTERLAEAGVEPSVGSVGDSYDNALAETINRLYKITICASFNNRGRFNSPATQGDLARYKSSELADWVQNAR